VRAVKLRLHWLRNRSRGLRWLHGRTPEEGGVKLSKRDAKLYLKAGWDAPTREGKVTWFLRAAGLGDPRGFRYLAKVAEDTKGAAQTYALRLLLGRLAIRSGETSGMNMLSIEYFRGTRTHPCVAALTTLHGLWEEGGGGTHLAAGGALREGRAWRVFWEHEQALTELDPPLW